MSEESDPPKRPRLRTLDCALVLAALLLHAAFTAALAVAWISGPRTWIDDLFAEHRFAAGFCPPVLVLLLLATSFVVTVRRLRRAGADRQVARQVNDATCDVAVEPGISAPPRRPRRVAFDAVAVGAAMVAQGALLAMVFLPLPWGDSELAFLAFDLLLWSSLGLVLGLLVFVLLAKLRGPSLPPLVNG